MSAAHRENSFPFIGWRMYGAVHDDSDPERLELVAVRSDGRREALVVSELLDYPTSMRVRIRLAVLAKRVRESDDPEERQRHRDLFDIGARALARIEAERAPNLPIERIEVSRVSLPMDRYSGRESLEREPLWTVGIGGAP
jgi:hypothetical protein